MLNRSPKRSKGFTLLEVVITVVILAILVAVALPSYEEQRRRSRRADAQSAMMDLASRQERFLLDARSYATALSALNISVPTSVDTYYAVTVSANNTATPPTFTITAAPRAGTAQQSDVCGTLTLNSSGVKTPTTNRCWS